jgi:hypothetical protein
MVQCGVKKPRKKRQTSFETWQRARDLIASGRLSLREVARECGLVHSTLLRKKKAEGWYDPHEQVESLPPPPPKLVKKKQKDDGIVLDIEKATGETDAPKKEDYQDLLVWMQDLLAWALSGVSLRARNLLGAQEFLIEKLPNVIKSLALAGNIRGGSKEEEAAALQAELEERFALLPVPEIKKKDRGEKPERKNFND